MQHIIYFLPEKRCQQSPLQQKGKGRSCQLWKSFILTIPQRKCICPSHIYRDDSEENNPVSQKFIIPVARHTLKLWHKPYYFLFRVEKKSCKRRCEIRWNLRYLHCCEGSKPTLPKSRQSLLLFLTDFTSHVAHIVEDHHKQFFSTYHRFFLQPVLVSMCFIIIRTHKNTYILHFLKNFCFFTK